MPTPATSMPPVPPQPHFPGSYQRPQTTPTAARLVRRPDGAGVAAFVYGTCSGARTPTLFLHGNGEEHGIFGPQIDAVVASGHVAIAIDSRAQGKSTRGTAPLTYELMAADALACLDALGVERAHLVGFSDGAIEALLIARDHPRTAASLLSIGANLTPEGVMEEDGWDIRGTIATRRAWARWAQELPADGILDPALLTPTAGEAQMTADLLQLMLDEPHVDAVSLAAIVCPTTVMVGEFDCIVPAETDAIVCGVRAGGARVRKVVVPDAGHSLPKEAPEAVISELLELIGCAEHDEAARPHPGGLRDDDGTEQRCPPSDVHRLLGPVAGSVALTCSHRESPHRDHAGKPRHQQRP